MSFTYGIKVVSDTQFDVFVNGAFKISYDTMEKALGYIKWAHGA